MRRLRVLQIVAGLDVGGTFGGAERSGLELARALDREQFEVTVCSFWRCDTVVEASWLALLAQEGIPVFFATSPGERRNSTDYFKGAKKIVNWCREHPIDIIHAHHEGGALAGLCARAGFGARATMRTAHVPLCNEWGAGRLNGLLRDILSRGVFPLCLDAEVSISREHCDMLDRRWIARRFHRRADLVRNARPLDVQSVEIRAQLPAVIGCVARLSTEKGVDRLLNAMPHVLAARPDAELIIAGDGPMRASLSALARDLGIQERVCFLGQREDVPGLLRQMSLFVLPSLYEGVSTALLEAIAAGVPVVASDVSGNKAIIEDGHSGWLVSTSRPEVFAAVILSALGDPAEGARRADAAQSVLVEYSIEAAAQSCADIYNRFAVERAGADR